MAKCVKETVRHYYKYSTSERAYSQPSPTSVPSTAQDYDFYEDVDEYKAPKTTVRHYYKYAYAPWTQPVLTSDTGNPELKVSVPSVLSSGLEGYKMFDGLTSTIWHSASGSSPRNVDIYSDKLLCITNLLITNRTDDASNVYPTSRLDIYYSDDGNSYTLINSVNNSVTGAGQQWNAVVTNSNYYHYYRFQFYNSYPYGALAEIAITATTKTIQECTPAEAEWHEDVVTYYVVEKQ